MPHQPASEAQNEQLAHSARDLVSRLDTHGEVMRELLPPALASSYRLCYWTDACLYCTDDGRHWYLVRCIV